MKPIIMTKHGYRAISINIMKTSGIPFLESDLYWEYNKN